MEIKPKRDLSLWSFQSSNIQELLRIPEEEYESPNIPISLPVFDEVCDWESAELTEEDEHLSVYGRKAKKKFFLLEESCCFLNHGAFGSASKEALVVSHEWQLYSERQPRRFYERELLPLLVLVTRQLANFLDCAAKDLVLINNITYGTNSALKSLCLGPKDVILTFNITCGAVKRCVHHLCEGTGAVIREANIKLPLADHQQILDVLESELEKEDVTIVVLEHVPSCTPFVMPVKKIISACQSHKVKTFVDGSHAVGSLPLNIADLDPDFYVSDGYKWLCCPKGAAFLYVKPSLQHLVQSADVSHGLGTSFSTDFMWAGQHDYSPMLSLLTVLSFWKSLGVDRIQNYMHRTVYKGAKVLMQAWGSEIAAPEHLFASMVLVELPTSFQSKDSSALDDSHAEEIQNKLYHQFNIEVPVKCIQGKLYVRISAHIYNEVSDYEKLAKAVLMISQKKGNKLL